MSSHDVPLEDPGDDRIEETNEPPYMNEQEETDKFRHKLKLSKTVELIPEAAKLFKQFHREKHNTDREPEEEEIDNNQQRFQTWLKDRAENDREVMKIMNQLYANPQEWIIDFEALTNEEKVKLFPLIHDFFDTIVRNLSIQRRFNLAFEIAGEWHTRYLESVFPETMKKFTLNNFVYNIGSDNYQPFASGANDYKMPKLSTIDRLRMYPVPHVRANNDIGAHFFEYLTTEKTPPKVVEYLKRLQIFDKLTNDKEQQRSELNDCCFVYALKMLNFSEERLNQIRLRINNRYLSQTKVNDICKEFKIYLRLKYYDLETTAKRKGHYVRQTIEKNNRKRYIGVAEKEAIDKIELNIFQKHYFIQETSPFSSYYIEHIEELEEDKFNKRWDGSRWKKAEKNRYVSSLDLVVKLFAKGYFKPITIGEYSILKTTFFNEIDQNDFISLEYNPEFCVQKIVPPKPREEVNHTYFFADFEAQTKDVVYHIPYLCCCQSVAGGKIHEFWGEQSPEQFLDFLPDGAVVFFHNLSYDARMFVKLGIYNAVNRGNQMMSCQIDYKNKKISFHDTLAILQCRLDQLPEMFKIPSGEKELFPYRYYTLELLAENVGVISEAGTEEKIPWSEKEYEQFNQNIDKIPGCRIDDDHFNMKLYASFYCKQDVNILRLAFNKFRAGWFQDFGFDAFRYLTISSLANEVFARRVYYPNGNLYKVGGIVRQFLSRAVHGGRCMCAFNKKWDVLGPLVDYDAVSLYPSAMARLWTVEGMPLVIPDDKLTYDFIKDKAAFVVDIEITKANKHYAFPLIIQKKDGKNTNDDNITEPVTMTVDNIELEDLIHFQQIEFKVIRGYYWDGKRDYRIQEEIKKIFQKRVEYKKEKNPLQQLYKLVMNSCYGKSIEKAHDTMIKYIKGEEKLQKFSQKNYYKIIETVPLHNSDIYAVKVVKQIDKHFNFSLFGIQVLSMSKRIMNEVMCLAYDIGCKIFYQDTDSMHIMMEDLDKLRSAYKEKYNRDLEGTNLGQFHSDFASDGGREDVEYSLHSIFLMKKMYYDELLMSDGTIEPMTRGKGLTLKSIHHLAETQFDGDLLKLYRYMYLGNPLTFDLTVGKVRMQMNKNMTVETKKSFTRTTSTKYESGKVDEYFK